MHFVTSGYYLVQGMLLASGGPDLFRKLLEKGPDHRITQPAVFATANLAASNHAAQEALRESGTHSTANWSCPPQGCISILNEKEKMCLLLLPEAR